MKILSKFFKGFKKSFNDKGFTLIELLVVIGILGILAAGLLAAIDPLEQFRKGADTNKKSTSLELVNALTRYYAVHGAMPWAAAGGDVNCNAGITDTPAAVQVSGLGAASSFGPCIDVLYNEGELKKTFATQFQILTKLYVTQTAPSPSVTAAVCFDPESKSESSRPETKYSQDPTGAACDPTTTTTCYWCAQ